jgi:hypothetical protein
LRSFSSVESNEAHFDRDIFRSTAGSIAMFAAR